MRLRTYVSLPGMRSSEGARKRASANKEKKRESERMVILDDFRGVVSVFDDFRGFVRISDAFR